MRQAVSSLAATSGSGALAPFPTRGKEGQEIRDLIGVLFRFGPVDIDAETRRVRDLDPPVDHLHRRGDDLALPVDVELVEELLHQKVRRAGADLDADRGEIGPCA